LIDSSDEVDEIEESKDDGIVVPEQSVVADAVPNESLAARKLRERLAKRRRPRT